MNIADRYQQQIQNDWERYGREINTLAYVAYTQHVRPFCKKRGWRFVSGMGIWCMYDVNGEHHTEHTGGTDPELDAIIALLEIEIPGHQHAGDFGTFMGENS